MLMFPHLTFMRKYNDFLMSLLGLAIVFAIMLLALGVIQLSRFVLSRRAPQPPLPPEASSQSPDSADAPPLPGFPAEARGVVAPGSLGEIKLYGVPDKTAALIMAIVAEETQAPLNELRFISVREV